ncbi:DUF4087 domain-containing protein [Vibrio owensii]
MRFCIVFLGMFFALTAIAEETRCGWLENPSPANMWLIDRDGTWNILFQGTPSVLNEESMELLYQAIANENEFVRTNRSHGFSCACLTVDADKGTNSITAIYKSKQLPLKQCLEDISITEYIPLPFK